MRFFLEFIDNEKKKSDEADDDVCTLHIKKIAFNNSMNVNHSLQFYNFSDTEAGTGHVRI
jgi:hypothetical protein